MDANPYEDNYLVHLHFHNVEKYIFPLQYVLPYPNHKVFFFSFFSERMNIS